MNNLECYIRTKGVRIATADSLEAVIRLSGRTRIENEPALLDDPTDGRVSGASYLHGVATRFVTAWFKHGTPERKRQQTVFRQG
jgi:hypothetical protein